MLALLLIPVLVAGFVACHIHPLYFYKLHRYEGQYLYLKSAELGLKCFLIAIIIAMGLHIAVPESYLIFNRDIRGNIVRGSAVSGHGRHHHSIFKCEWS